jgi:CRP-like cAMP-binding protein
MLLEFVKKHFEPPHFAALREISLFAELSTGELRTVDGLLHQRTYIQDEIVFDEGEKGQAIYFILQGKVLVCRQGRPLDGVIAEISAGECFGELALLDDVPRMAQVRAAESCTLAVLFRNDFLNLLQTHSVVSSKLSLQLARLIGSRLRGAVYRYVV